MKKIILALLLVLALVSTSEGQRNLRKIQRGNPTGSGDPLRSTAGGSPPASAGCASCNSGNDSALVESGTTTSSSLGLDQNQKLAFKFTLAAERCITGGYYRLSGTGVTGSFEIWTDSSGTPGSLISAGYSKSQVLSDSEADNEFVFAATQTLSAGTYWAVFTNTTAASCVFYYGTSGSGVHYYYDTSWSEAGGGAAFYRVRINGCTP